MCYYPPFQQKCIIIVIDVKLRYNEQNDNVKHDIEQFLFYTNSGPTLYGVNESNEGAYQLQNDLCRAGAEQTWKICV